MADVKELAARAPAQYKADNLCVVRLCVGVGMLGSRICSAFSDSERFCIPSTAKYTEYWPQSKLYLSSVL